jgi:ATP-dependent HslUV protease ATP-binding subunit HslU
VVPKNILMIGPTGCGKTEIARRLSILCQAPFVKVEATKFTEVGFHGKDVDTIIKDLVEASIKLVKKRQARLHRDQARKAAERTILQLLGADQPQADGNDAEAAPGGDNWLEALRKGHLDEKEVDVEVTPTAESKGENQTAQMMLSMMNGARMEGAAKKRMLIKAALPLLEEQELAKLIDQSDVTKQAITEVKKMHAVFFFKVLKRYKNAIAGSLKVQQRSTTRSRIESEMLYVFETGPINPT